MRYYNGILQWYVPIQCQYPMSILIVHSDQHLLTRLTPAVCLVLTRDAVESACGRGRRKHDDNDDDEVRI